MRKANGKDKQARLSDVAGRGIQSICANLGPLTQVPDERFVLLNMSMISYAGGWAIKGLN